ncbi:hypothetical protein CHELA40_50722 [Chelatococcus asaccharovorans]|nr:hypothetical protein CHELA40_50722 [Chelatococcus asaccharovorans]
MAIDDACCRRDERSGAMEGRFELPGGGGVQDAQPFDAIGGRMRRDTGDAFALAVVSGNDQFATGPVRDATLGTISVKPPATFHAEACHQAAMGIVDARMDHLAVARGCLCADGAGGFEDEDIPPRLGEAARDGKADNAGTDNNDIDVFHAFGLSLCFGARSATLHSFLRPQISAMVL